MFLSSDWLGDYPQWEEAATGSSAASPSGGANELTAGNSTGNAITIYTGGGAIVDTDNGCEFIVVARVTSVLTTMSFFFGVSDTGGTFPLENSEAHFGVGIIYRAGTDTNWTLAGQDGGGTLTVAASSTAVVQNEWHRFRVRVLTDGSAALYIDGATSAAATLAAAVVGGGPAQVFLSTLKVTANVTRTSEIEVVHLWKPYAA